ncbi:hypothetical protein FRAHR75_750035 [Frankia sp. Hr75.2]|nr:hypothetical protein FRAHR75_750035 [Frankia sp. Hr75.2]
MGLHLSQIAEADALLTNDPLALLIGMVLDQSVSERWSGRDGVRTCLARSARFGLRHRVCVAAALRRGAACGEVRLVTT